MKAIKREKADPVFFNHTKDLKPTRIKKNVQDRSTPESFWQFFSKPTSSRRKDSKRIRQKRGWVQIRQNVMFILIGLFVTVIIVLFAMKLPQQYFHQFVQNVVTQSGRYGFVLKKIVIIGQTHISQKDVVNTLKIAYETPIFNYDLKTMHEKLSQNPWVKDVLIQRRLPSVFHITVQERKPIAIWNERGKHFLIDTDGVVIHVPITSEFKNLMLIAGTDAPSHAPEIIHLLEKFPKIRSRTTGLVRIQKRRWNLKLDQKIVIKLPEEDLESAFIRLMALLNKNRLSADNIIFVDLRLADQIFIKMTDQAAQIMKLQIKGSEKV